MINSPIGILDSGLGGLTVWKSVVKLLPNESTIYIADSKNIPYGLKTKPQVYQLAKRMTELLLSKKVKMIIVACNTITVSCITELRSDFPAIPIVGTVPVIKKAAEISKNGRIGIFSTSRTAKSRYQSDLIKKFAGHCKVFSVGSDKIVPLIESGDLNSAKMRDELGKALSVLKNTGIDTLCLGCTHFPFLEKEIQEIIGEEVLLLEPSSAIARHTKNILTNNRQLSVKDSAPKHLYYTTGDVKIFETVAKSLLHATIRAEYSGV